MPKVTVSSDATVLVAVLADAGGYAGAQPDQLVWGTQILTNAVSIDNGAAVGRNTTIYYLYNPTLGSGNITGDWVSTPTDYWVSVYTLNGVDTTVGPLTDSVNGFGEPPSHLRLMAYPPAVGRQPAPITPRILGLTLFR